MGKDARRVADDVAADAATGAAAADDAALGVSADAPAAQGVACSKERSADAARSKPDRLWTPLFVFIIAMTLCCFMVGQGLNSGTSVYLDRLGEGATLAGVLAAVFSAAAAVTRLACGPIIDNVGRVVVMLCGTVFLFAGSILPVLATDAPVFFLARVLQGIGFSAATTASATAASDALPLSRMGEGIGYYGLGQALAMSVGPAFALFLVGTDPAENLYAGMALVAALAIVFTLLCRYEKNPSRLPATSSYRQRFEELKGAGRAEDAAAAPDAPAPAAPAPASPAAVPDAAASDAPATTASATASAGVAASADAAAPASPLRRFVDRFFEPRALPGMLPMLVLSPAFGFGIFFMGLYGTSLGYANAGLFYTVSAVAMIVVRLTSKAFMDRVAPIKIMTGAVACGLVGFAMVFAGGASEVLFYAAGIPYGLCLGVSLPLNQSVAVKNTPPERWGATNALFQLANDIGIGTASVVWGIVNDTAGFSTTLICVMCCIVASLVVAWIAYPKEARR